MTAGLRDPADRSVDAAAGKALQSGGRISRIGLGIGPRAREAAAVVAGSLAVSAVMTWPVLRNPTKTVPQDLVDPLYFVWQIAWTGHALRTDPLGMWTTNAFNHAGTNLAYTDTVIGYAPFAAVFDLFGGVNAALLSYNLLYVLATALVFGSAYLLARVLGANTPGALVLAAAVAFAPWRLAHARHLNVLSTGGIVLAFALLAYGHGWVLRWHGLRDTGENPEPPARITRPAWIVAGWAVACWQLTLGFAVGIPFAWVLAGVMLTAAAIGWPQRPWDRRLVRADLGGGLAFTAVGIALTLPYLSVVHHFPIAARTDGMVGFYSPQGRSLVTAPAESWWWGGLQAAWRTGMTSAAEKTLLPGLVIAVLAVIGLRWSVWSVRARCGLGLSAAVFAVLALGTSAPGDGRYTYLLLFHHLPGWSALRTPGRLVLWTGLALGLLAAGAVTYAAARLGPRRTWRVTALLLVPATLVLAEGAGAVAQPVVPAPPIALKDVPGPVLIMPTSMQSDFLVMTWSTDGWPSLINGGSGFEPPHQSRLRTTAAQFPAPASAKVLRTMGVRTIVLVKSQAVRTQWERLATQPAELTRTQAYLAGASMRETKDALIFDLDP